MALSFCLAYLPFRSGALRRRRFSRGRQETYRGSQTATEVGNSCGWRGERRYQVLRSGCLLRHRCCGLSDHVEHKVGLGQHRNVAAISLEGLRSHTLCDETLQVGLDGTVMLATMYQLGFDRQAVPSTF
jgi:hypothetical protein